MALISWTDAQIVGRVGHMQIENHAVKIASVSYSTKRNDPKPWVLRTEIPGWKNARHHETIGQAQETAERIIQRFGMAAVGDLQSEIARLKSIIGDMPVVTERREALIQGFMDLRVKSGGCMEGPDCGACRRIAGDEADVALSVLSK